MGAFNKFYTSKCLRDSTGTVRLIVISSDQDPAIKVTFGDTDIEYTESVEKLYLGYTKSVISFSKETPKNLLFNILFLSGEEASSEIKVPAASEKLLVPYDALTHSFLMEADASNKTYSFVDAVYYPSIAKTKKTKIYPSSDKAYLDTSEGKDFYYTADGAIAYIASNDLQNSFLKSLDYTVNSETLSTIGRFKGGGHQSLKIACEADGPKVYGSLNCLSLKPLDPEAREIAVDKNPGSTQFYLKGCLDDSYPCTDDPAKTHAADCLGFSLTSEIINSSNLVQGCSAGPCEGFSISIQSAGSYKGNPVEKRSAIVQVTGGSSAYTVTTKGHELIDSATGDYSDSTFNPTEDFFTLDGLDPGIHKITVVDDSTACSVSLFAYFPKEKNSKALPEGVGCTQALALNFDAAATQGADEICVYCDSDAGTLTAGGVNDFSGDWAKLKDEIKITPATSQPDGTNNTNGVIIAPSVTVLDHTIGAVAGGDYEFVGADHFNNSAQPKPYDYLLYRLTSIKGYTEAMDVALRDGTPLQNVVDAFGALASTISSGTSSTVVFKNLQASYYVLKVKYETRDCFILSDLILVGQSGCTDPEAVNYNSDATVEDGSCNRSRAPLCDGKITMGFDVECLPGIGSAVSVEDLLPYNLNLESTWNLAEYLIESPGNPNLGETFNPSEQGYTISPRNQAVAGYIWTEIFCQKGFPVNPNFFEVPEFGTPGFTNSLGDQVQGSIAPTPLDSLKYIIVKFIVGFQDANNTAAEIFTQSGTPITLFDLVSNPNTVVGIIPNDLIDQYGAAAYITAKYTFGEIDQWNLQNEYKIGFLPEDGAIMRNCTVAPVSGCTDPLANNYNALAEVDNGSCTYDTDVVQEEVGCMDQNASNFNPNASIPDVCIYGTVGTWFCLAGGCSYNSSSTFGFDTQAECEEICNPEPDDCTRIQSADIDPFTVTTVNAPSEYDPENPEICLPTANGKLTINFPDLSELIASVLNNSVYFYIVILRQIPGGMIEYYTNGDVVNMQTGPLGIAVPYPQPGELLLANDYSSGSFAFSATPPGVWNVYIRYYADTFTDQNGLISVAFNSTCYLLETEIAIVGLDSCEASIVYGCTDPESEDYDDTATVDDGSCTYPCSPCAGECLCPNGSYSVDCCPQDPQSGCTDPNAINFNPLASIEDNSCIYEGDPPGGAETGVIPACIPPGINGLINYNDVCIADSGNRYYNKLLTGTLKGCDGMDTWKMIIIQELLQNKGLPCIYNCTDEGTPVLTTTLTDCNAAWQEAGSLIWLPSGTYSLGAIVRRALPTAVSAITGEAYPNGRSQVYIAVSTSGLNIDPASARSGWKLCTSSMPPSNPPEYLQKFISFAREYCRDCGIPPYAQEVGEVEDVEVNFSAGGVTFTNNNTGFTL